MKTPILAVTALVVAATGCGEMYPHLKLDTAPDTSAAYAARADYYKAHSADSYDGASLMLHDGTHVYWPEDLRPAVDPTSPTAKAIDRVEEGRKALAPMEAVSGGGALVAAGGLAAMTASLVPLMLTAGGDNPLLDTATFGLLGVGTVALCGGGLVAGIAPMFFMAEQQRFSEAIQSVVTTYPQSLSDRTGIQPDANGRLVDVTEGMVGGEAAPRTADVKDL